MPDNERDLEKELRDLGPHLEYPPTPGLARAARQRIEKQDAERTARRGRFWLPALSPRWAVAAMFVIVLAAPVLSPAARDTLSGLFITGGASSGAGGGAAQSAGDAGGDGADKAMSGQAESQAAPAQSGSSIPESADGGREANATESGGGGQPESGMQAAPIQGGGNESGREHEKITLREARSQAGNAPVLPPRASELGRPDAVYARRASTGTEIVLVYRTQPGLPPLEDTGVGLVLTETPGDIGSAYLPGIANKAGVEEVSVNGRRGYWMSGWFTYWIPDARRDPYSMSNPKESVLFWEQEGLALRLESSLGREDAIRIAESVR